MCGRYYIDNAKEDIPEDLVISEKTTAGLSGDIHPGDCPGIFIFQKNRTILTDVRWGIPKPGSSTLLINARSETVFDRPMFRNAARCSRCIIPADGFYEWSSSKDQYAFETRDRRRLYLAGIVTWEGDTPRFVILTKAPEKTVGRIHDRQPLILPKDRLHAWLSDEQTARALLSVPGPDLVERRTDGQLTFTFI